jgi:hypothetical protein
MWRVTGENWSHNFKFAELAPRHHNESKPGFWVATEMDTRRLQFSLRSVFVLISLCAIVLALAKALGVELLLGFSGFFLSCGFVLLLVYAMTPFHRLVVHSLFSSALVFIPVLYCTLATIFFLFGEAIDQPHPAFLIGNWVTAALDNFWPVLPIVGIATVILVALDGVVQQSRPRDVAYYPRFSNLRTALARFELRLPLVIGLMLVFAYYAFTVVEVWHNQQYPGELYWPPKRVFLTCLFLWEVLWLADCLSRPRHGTIVAAIGYLCFTFFFLLPFGSTSFSE